jgi:adenylosuccinate synthase
MEAIIGVIKAYTTRVGSGPFPTEETGDTENRLRQAGGEFGATTGRSRRCGWFDVVAVKYAARINGFSTFALTKLDVLDEFDKIRVCTHYKRKNEIVEDFPATLQTLASCEPVYETIEGWQSPTDHCRKFEELPKKAQHYVKYLEDILSVPISYISVGIDRKQIIFR